MPAPPPPTSPSDSVYIPRAKPRSSTLSAKSNYQADKDRRTKVAKVDGRRIYGDPRGYRARERTVSFCGTTETLDGCFLDVLFDLECVEEGEVERKRAQAGGLNDGRCFFLMNKKKL